LKYFKVVDKAKIADGKVMEAVIIGNPDYEKCNIKKSTKLLKEVAESNAQAMYLLGLQYEAGKDTVQDMATSVDYISKAAEMGYSDAECALADIYYEGRGVDQNYETAVAWYAKAFKQGQLTENAAKRYASCYENGWGGLEKDSVKAEGIRNKDYKNHITDLLKLF
jgi:TPR repeat protein